uniref:Aa_trans domain-containing protein n=1 Tax=Heterorhabditis bacteriophora TaxID=37862 RepID=A0A1I7X818_HETBA
MAAVFIVGDMAGGGMIALPNAVVNTGKLNSKTPGTSGLIPGLILISLCALCSGYTGMQLADNWTMLQERWKTYREHCRKPYGEMAFRAHGVAMRSFVAFMVCLTQFGFATVLILLAAKNLAILLNFFFALKINYCYLIIVVGLIIWPATMLKSPMHFWQVAVFSALSSSLAVFLLIMGMIHDAPVCAVDVSYPDFDIQKFFMAYGTMVFAFGGHAAFPTIQHDMKKPRLFNRSVAEISAVPGNSSISISHNYLFLVIIVFYMSVSLMGYLIYGGSVGEAIIPSIQLQWVQQTNSAGNVSSSLDKHLRIKRRISSQFVSSIIAYTPRHILIINLCSLTFGLIGGVVATVSSIIKLTGADMAAPCYVQYIRNGKWIILFEVDYFDKRNRLSRTDKTIIQTKHYP